MVLRVIWFARASDCRQEMCSCDNDAVTSDATPLPFNPTPLSFSATPLPFDATPFPFDATALPRRPPGTDPSAMGVGAVTPDNVCRQKSAESGALSLSQATYRP